MARARGSRKGEAGAAGAGGPRASRRREPTLADEIAASGETPVDALAAAQRADRADRTFLGREFLTWLVYHAEVDGGGFAGGGDVAAFTLAFGGRLVLRTVAGQVTDITLKGPAPGGSADLRYAVAGGLSVKEADLRLEQGERAWSFALAAENFDLKRIKPPDLLGETEGDAADADSLRLDERMVLLGHLDAAVRLAFTHFLALRTRPSWSRTVLPALRRWLEQGT